MMAAVASFTPSIQWEFVKVRLLVVAKSTCRSIEILCLVVSPPVPRGDCDTDDDCQEGLYCYQRNGLQSVPFCDGAEKMTENPDFCTWNTSHPPPFLPPTKPPGVFQFKLYWEEGYLWQNETVEREWCMVADYGGYPGNGYVKSGISVCLTWR